MTQQQDYEAPIDWKRRVLKNPDGTSSTESSIGIEEDGRYINIATVIDGKRYSDDEAVRLYHEGKNQPLGIFGSQERADTAATARHMRWEAGPPVAAPPPVTPRIARPDEDRLAQLRALGQNGNLPAVSAIDPDAHAKAIQLAAARGLSTAEAATVLRGASAAQARQLSGDSFGPSNPLSARSPTLQAWLANADNAAVAQDDARKFTEMDEALLRLRPDRSMVGDYEAALGEGFSGLEASYYHLAVATGRLSPEEAARGAAAANLSIRQSRLGASKAQRAYEQELADASWWGVIPTALSSPRGLAGMVLQNFAFGLPSLTLGAVGGAAVALAGAGPIGAGVGMVAGAFTGGMAVEFGAWVDQQLGAANVDTTDPDQLARAYRDTELMGRIQAEAIRKGIGTAGIDALSTLIGMRGAGAAARVGEAALKRGAIHLAKELAAQSALESVGEATGQIAAVGTGKVNWKDVSLEGVASLGQSGGEMALGRTIRFLASRKLAGAQAVQDGAAVGAAAKAWTGSKLVGRLPERARDFVQAQLVGQDEELFAARFDKEAWDEHWKAQGKDPAAEAVRVLPVTGRQAYLASEDSGALAVPLGNFLDAYADSTDLAPLTELARWRNSDSPNLREQGIAGGEQVSALEDEVGRSMVLWQRERDVSDQIAAIDEQLRALPVEQAGEVSRETSSAAHVSPAGNLPASTAEIPVEVPSLGPPISPEVGAEAPIAQAPSAGEPAPTVEQHQSAIREIGGIIGSEPQGSPLRTMGEAEILLRQAALLAQGVSPTAEAAAAAKAQTRTSLVAKRATLAMQLNALALQRQDKELRGAEIQKRVEADLIKAGRPATEAKHGATI